MNWENIDLSDSYERSQSILDSISFDSLLLDIYHGTEKITKESITAQFENELREKVRSAKETFNDNLDNILKNALNAQNENENPNKPTTEEFQETINLIEKNQGTPQEIKTKGSYYLDYFTECLPPIIWSNKMVLCSEPYDHNNEGKGLYMGIFKKQNNFFGVITTVKHFKTLI
jgi:hypothetical protein